MSMMQLPAPLEPWRPWLSLFPADLAAPLGQFLLRLHPQIGALRSAPARNDALPEGVGSIVQRGPYERMLITEWAYADAEPDEFIRRAASGELMFTGPEPAARQRSRRCVALFDAGPGQLGEPRLLHLALFILLARRAEEAGAVFEWGILQRPSVLYRESGKDGIATLLKARTLTAFDAPARLAWEAVIDTATDDVWVVGGPGLEAPRPLRAQVSIGVSLLAEQLDVSLRMLQATRTLSLVLPAPDIGIRLLRSPFEPRASRADIRQSNGRPSLQQPPRFAAYGNWLAVAQLDGSVVVYHIPDSTKNKPGKLRRHPAPAAGSVLGAGMFGRSFACIISEGETLSFKGFPCAPLTTKANTCTRPPAERFRAPPMSARWLQTFFFRHTDNKEKQEEPHVIALDLDRQLGCWSARSRGNAALVFRHISQDVIGALQSGQQLLFACAGKESTELYSWNPARGSAQIATVPRTGTQLFFGNGKSWSNDQQGLVGLRCSDTDWLVGNGTEWVTIAIEDRASVLGVAASGKHAIYGLVVRSPDKMTIELRTRFARHVLVKSPEPIAQACINPLTADIAWIGGMTLRVTVQGLDEEKPYLQVSMDEAEHAQ
jgi:hypothetical protein